MHNVIDWLKRNCDNCEAKGDDYFYGKLHGRHVRLNGDKFQVGCVDFDRWANSVSVTIEIDAQHSFIKEINMAMHAAFSRYEESYMERLLSKLEEVARNSLGR